MYASGDSGEFDSHTERREGEMMPTPGQIEIQLGFSQHLGPRFKGAGVVLQFDSLKRYSFSSSAKWPTDARYDDTVRDAVESVLREKQGSLDVTAVHLKEIQWHEVDSSEDAFARVARAATLAAFELKVVGRETNR